MGTTTKPIARDWPITLLGKPSTDPVPTGLVLDHKCCNPDCARPAHLRLVTLKQNNEHRTSANRNNASSGVRGVQWSDNRYRVRVRHNNILYKGGNFVNLEEAAEAAVKLRAQLFTHDDGRRF